MFFVPGVWLDESGEFEVTQVSGQTGQARLVALENASSHRRTPPCPHQGFTPGSCGGCPWQFIDDEAQLAAKEQRVRSVLSQLLPATAIQPIWASPKTLGYRNRTQVKTDGRQLGYVSSLDNTLAPIEDCLVLSDKNRGTLKHLIEQLPNPAWRSGGARHWQSLEFDDFLDASNVSPGVKRPFLQGNSAQNERMRDWLREVCAAIDSGAAVIELFAGSGNFTEVMSACGFSRVIAVDSFAPAIEALNQRGLPEVEGLTLDLFRPGSTATLKKALKNTQVLLLDPPRDGYSQIKEVLSSARKLEWIIYISCDLATYRRDVKFAVDSGFEILELQPLDLFPQTPHVEIMSVLRKTRK
ncbi:MAG: TRAM domain-containing protein [Congregibacter sp.]